MSKHITVVICDEVIGVNVFVKIIVINNKNEELKVPIDLIQNNVVFYDINFNSDNNICCYNN